MTMISTFWRKYAILFLIICGSSLLMLANLGNRCLWQDEAQTALISKTILTDGVPKGYDGKNYFSQELGAEYGENYIWKWHTWLPFYVLAGFYEIFGVSTYVSRLPFALFGIGTVPAIYFFTKKILQDNRTALIAAALLAICVPFLLLCRQSRYYSMTILFSVLALHAYVLVLEKKKFAGILFFLWCTLLFHSQHFYIVVLFAAVFLHVIIFRRNRLKTVTILMIIVLLVNGPWLIWLMGMKYSQINDEHLVNFGSIVQFILMSVVNIFRYLFHIWLMAFAAAAYFLLRKKTGNAQAKDGEFWKRLALPVFFIVFNIIFIAFISPYPYFRYIAPSIPLLIILKAIIINALLRINIIASAMAITVLLVSSSLAGYLDEITHYVYSPSECIYDYLNKNGSADDVVAISYGDMPLKFYTKMRIVGGLTGENMAPAKDAKWIIIRNFYISNKDKDMDVKKFLFNNIDFSKYRKIVLDCPDSVWDNREEISEHNFRTLTTGDKIEIFERED